MAFPSGYSAPGLFNAYVPTFDDQANLIVGYSRNEKDFALNQYVQMFTAGKMDGFWLKFNPLDQARVPFAQGNNWTFADGQRRSLQDGHDTNSRFGWVEYRMDRFSPKGTIGYLTLEQAQWDVKKKILDDLAFKCMIQRVRRAYAVIDDSTQYATSHVSTATAIGGGLWTAGTITAPYIKNSLAAIRNAIQLDTLGKVHPKDLRLIINPVLAKGMAGSQEVHTYLAQQVDSMKVIDGSNPDQNLGWGLPDKMYGFQLIVENTVMVPQLESVAVPGADVAQFVFGDTTAYVVARPGGINGDAGGSSFSTLVCLQLKSEEMVPETFDIPEDKLINTYLLDCNTFILSAPESGYKVTSCA